MTERNELPIGKIKQLTTEPVPNFDLLETTIQIRIDDATKILKEQHDKMCKDCEYDPQAAEFGWFIKHGWLPPEEVRVLKEQHDREIREIFEEIKMRGEKDWKHANIADPHCTVMGVFISDKDLQAIKSKRGIK